MKTVIVTGSAGLIGSETVRRFANEGFRILGIDNDLRAQFFGPNASTARMRDRLIGEIRAYEHHAFDIRDSGAVNALFKSAGSKTALVVHTAAQPSHDWAARDPQMDFGVNANGTSNLLEAARPHCPEA